MTLYKWSQVAASNGSADPSCPFPEGMAPSAYNDSERGAMAAIAKYRDDIAGAIITGGTSIAYTVATYQGFDTLAHLNGQMVAFSPHVTNGAGPVTINFDGLGAKPLRPAPGVELLAATIIQGTPYVGLYNSVDGVVYLQGFFGNPYNVPLCCGLDFWGATAPNSSFVFPFGQALSRTTYANAFAIFGTAHGSGDGSTTFNIPDLRGRVVAGKDDMGGASASRLGAGGGFTGGNSVVLGSAGGGPTVGLTLGQLPTGITSANASQALALLSDQGNVVYGATTGSALTNNGGPLFGPGSNAPLQIGQIRSSGNVAIGVTSNNTSGTVHDNVQPTIISNYIIRVI